VAQDGRDGGASSPTAVPTWAEEPPDERFTTAPGDLATLLEAAGHARSAAVGLTVGLLAKRPLEASAYALVGVAKDGFRGVVRQAYKADDPSLEAIGFRSVSAFLTGDAVEAHQRVRRAAEDSPARGLVEALDAAMARDHQTAGERASCWARHLPGPLGPATAAAAVALAVDQGNDMEGRVYWSDLLVRIVPNDPAVAEFRAECHAVAARAEKDSAKLIAALELRRAVVLARPGSLAARARFIKLAEEIGHRRLGPLDLSMVRFFNEGGPRPEGTIWADPHRCWCSGLLDLTGNVVNELLGTHLELVASIGPLGIARCVDTGSAWVVVAKGTINKENLTRAIRLSNVSFSPVSLPEAAALA